MTSLPVSRFGLALSLMILGAPCNAADLSGVPRVIDGDTIVIGETHIRLWGIDAFETHQQCQKADGAAYDCGWLAKFALDTLVKDQQVNCADKGHDRYGRTVAMCSVNGVDLGGFMVRFGQALDWPKYSHGYYATEQTDAKASHRGVWAGSFEQPWDWRHRERGHQ